MTCTNPSIDESKKAIVRFGLGEEESKGMAQIELPVDDRQTRFEF